MAGDECAKLKALCALSYYFVVREILFNSANNAKLLFSTSDFNQEQPWSVVFTHWKFNFTNKKTCMEHFYPNLSNQLPNIKFFVE